MDIAIVILNYNGKGYLEKFLPSVTANSQDCQVTVADNCSTDDSLAFLKSNYPDLQTIEIPFNGGYSAGYNYALELIEAKYYVLLNSDIEVTPNWVRPIYEMMESDSTIAATQPKILSYHNKNEFEYAGAGGGQLDFLGYPFCRGRIFETVELDEGQYNDTTQVFWASGACLFIRSDVYHKIGGLDNDFFAHMEEIDLCWRINNLGMKVMYNGNVTVYHVGGGTLPKSNPRKTYLNFRNGLSLLLKNLNTSQLFYTLFSRMILDFVAALKFLVDGSGRDCWAVIKAVIHFIWLIPSNWKKRLHAKKEISLIQKDLIYPKSIVYQHFIKKKKLYKEL